MLADGRQGDRRWSRDKQQSQAPKPGRDQTHARAHAHRRLHTRTPPLPPPRTCARTHLCACPHSHEVQEGSGSSIALWAGGQARHDAACCIDAGVQARNSAGKHGAIGFGNMLAFNHGLLERPVAFACVCVRPSCGTIYSASPACAEHCSRTARTALDRTCACRRTA